jgi:hypothetical protein
MKTDSRVLEASEEHTQKKEPARGAGSFCCGGTMEKT